MPKVPIVTDNIFDVLTDQDEELVESLLDKVAEQQDPRSFSPFRGQPHTRTAESGQPVPHPTDPLPQDGGLAVEHHIPCTYSPVQRQTSSDQTGGHDGNFPNSSEIAQNEGISIRTPHQVSFSPPLNDEVFICKPPIVGAPGHDEGQLRTTVDIGGQMAYDLNSAAVTIPSISSGRIATVSTKYVRERFIYENPTGAESDDGLLTLDHTGIQRDYQRQHVSPTSGSRRPYNLRARPSSHVFTVVENAVVSGTFSHSPSF